VIQFPYRQRQACVLNVEAVRDRKATRGLAMCTRTADLAPIRPHPNLVLGDAKSW
jgi:hypothetical protein